MIAFRLNGQATTYDGDPAVSLLSYLRNDRHLTAAKDGCSGQAACGACLVELNGKACLACSTPMSKVTDGDVVTLEGLPETLRRTLGMAFVNRGAVQCGFCTPGFLMRAKVLLQTNPNPTREEVVKAVRPHLCRCTGYVKLVDVPVGSCGEPKQRTRMTKLPQVYVMGVHRLLTVPALFCTVHIWRIFEPHTLTRKMVRCLGLRLLS